MRCSWITPGSAGFGCSRKPEGVHPIQHAEPFEGYIDRGYQGLPHLKAREQALLEQGDIHPGLGQEGGRGGTSRPPADHRTIHAVDHRRLLRALVVILLASRMGRVWLPHISTNAIPGPQWACNAYSPLGSWEGTVSPRRNRVFRPKRKP